MIAQELSQDLNVKAMELLIRHVEQMALRAESARSDAQERANEHAGKLESRFDTFREEAQYLAYGQGLRRDELLTALRNCRKLLDAVRERGSSDERVRPGRIVSLLSESGQVRHYLIAAGGSGMRLGLGPIEVLVVSGSAPIASALLGLEVGDTVTLNGERNPEEWEIVRIV